MNKRTITLSAIVLILSSTAIQAQEPFLYDATRALSTGRALTSIADDETALFYNPAGLSGIEGRRISVSGYIQQYSWTIDQYVPEGSPNPNFTDRGFSVSYVQDGFGISFSQTGKGWWEHVDFIAWDAEGPDSFTAKPVNYERYATASYSHEILSWMSLGLTGRYLHFSHYGDSEYISNGDAVTFDLGIMVDINEGISLGMNLQNMVSTPIDYAVYNDYYALAYPSRLPLNCSVGIAWLPTQNLSVAADVRHLFQDDVKSDLSEVMLEFRRSYHIGCEWREIGGLALRIGYYYCERPVQRASPVVPFDYEGSNWYIYEAYNNITLGAGYGYRAFTLDIGLKLDDRGSKIEESYTTLRDTTAMGTASIAYSF